MRKQQHNEFEQHITDNIDHSPSWVALHQTDQDNAVESDRNGIGGMQNRPVNGVVVAVTGFYIGLVIVSVALFSTRLYSWSHNRILTSSSLSLAQQISAAAEQPTAESAATSASSSDSGPEAVSSQNHQPGAGAVSSPINILLMGTDARPTDVNPARTDTMMVVSLNPQDNTVGIVSLPRDLWVPIPGQNISTKINMAYVLGEEQRYPGGGAQLALDTVSSFIGRPVEYYVRLNFRGFVELVELIGGVDITIPQTIHDENYPTANFGVETFHLEAGPHHLDGETALKYVRTRNIDDDYGRARRQQQMLRAMVNQVLRADMIPTLITKIPTIFYTMRSSIDTNIPMTRLMELAQYGRYGAVDNIRQLVLDSQYGKETFTEDGAWILLPNREKTNAALSRFFAPAQVQSDGTAQFGGEAAWVRVEVLNGTGQPRIAARTRDLLESKGWQIVSIDDADRNDYQHTLIIDYGVPSPLVEQIGDDLNLTSAPSRLSLSSIDGTGTAPVDLRIVVGRDSLEGLQNR